jgi:hypothetical protein
MLHRFVAACDGEWKFPTDNDRHDRQLVLNALAENRLANEWLDRHSLFGDHVVERVMPVTILLPEAQGNIDVLLDGLWLAQLADISMYLQRCRRVRTALQGTQATFRSGFGPICEFNVGEDLRNTINQLVKGAGCDPRRTLQIYTRSHLYSKLEYTDWGRPFIEAVAKIVVSLSAWQITRVLMQMEAIIHHVHTHFEYVSEVGNDLQEYLQSATFGRYLRYARIEDGIFNFDMPPNVWISPFRLRCTTNGVEITVFQISPPRWDGELSPRSYWQPQIDEQYLPH